MAEIEIPSHMIVAIGLAVKQIAPFRTGNTAINAITSQQVGDHIEIKLSGTISPYGVGLNDGVGGWGNKNDARTGVPLKGWFTERGYNAALLKMKNMGGNYDGTGITDESIKKFTENNPASQEQMIRTLSTAVDEGSGNNGG